MSPSTGAAPKSYKPLHELRTRHVGQLLHGKSAGREAQSPVLGQTREGIEAVDVAATSSFGDDSQGPTGEHAELQRQAARCASESA